MGKRESLLGKQFGSWTVIEKVENYVSGEQKQTQTQWLCRCTCGYEKKFTTYSIKKESKECSHIWGKRLGKLVVLEPAERPVGNKTGTFVRCRCDCGNIYVCNKRSLIVGDAKSCGCSRTRLDDLTGQRMGNLVVMYRAEDFVSPAGYKGVYWHCKCDCGNEITVSSSVLKKGKKSCGCIKILPPNFKDLKGQRFGHLIVIEQAENIYSGGQSKVTWRCICDCGNETVVRGDALKSGMTKSCGCFANNTADDFQDLTKHRFDKLEVIGNYENRHSLWFCKCDCGNTTIKTRRQLLTNKINSCGCKETTVDFDIDIGSVFGELTIIDQLQSKKQKKQWLCSCTCGNERVFTSYDLSSGVYTDCGHVLEQKRDLTGQRFGRVVVLERVEREEKQSRWKCLCDCGNVTEAYGSHLKSGNVRSCGCLAKELTTERCLEDLTAQRFGLWTVIERALRPENVKWGTFWRCKCDCGNEGIIAASELKHSKSRSCGCNNRSKYEMWTEDILHILGYDYKTQLKFDDLTGIGQGKLSYDFGVYKNEILIALIECQGSQHYEPVRHFGGEKQFERQQLHDGLKREYAEKKLCVPLIEIPFWIKEYQEIFDIFSEYAL